MTASGHVSSLLASRSHLLYRVDGRNGAQSFWAYVLVDAPRLAAFKKAVNAGSIRVQEFGKLLVWGKGDQPGEGVREMLKQEYGFEVIA